MPSIMVSRLEKQCGRLAGFAGSLCALISEGLTNRWRHKLPDGQRVIDVDQIQTFISEELEEIHQLLVRHENAHVAELAEDFAAREVRDAAASELREKLFAARHIFEGIFGPTASRKIFQEDAEVPGDPIPLYRLGQRVQSNLLNPDFPLPPLRLDAGTQLDAIARGLDDPLQRLGTALRQLNWGLPDSKATLAAKELAMRQLTEEVGNVGRFLEALYVIAGHKAIAQRVRLSTHRSRGGEDEAEPEAAEAPPADDLPAELTTAPTPEENGSAAA